MYGVFAIAYDENSYILDYDQYFGEYDNLFDAKAELERLQENPDEVTADYADNDKIWYWSVEIQKLKSTEYGDECIDIIDSTIIYM